MEQINFCQCVMFITHKLVFNIRYTGHVKKISIQPLSAACFGLGRSDTTENNKKPSNPITGQKITPTDEKSKKVSIKKITIVGEAPGGAKEYPNIMPPR